ncbi:MAG: DUF7523 family protein [Halohasta sp.]
MSLAAETREAVRARPAVYDALRAGIVNYTAAADALDVEGDREAIATALRRFAADLDDQSTPPTDRSITVRLHSNVSWTDADALLAVDGWGIDHPGEGSGGGDEPEGHTAVHVTGDVDAGLLAETLARVRIAGIDVEAAGVLDGVMVLVVARRDGPQVVQVVEAVAASGA